ncbi:hypothetical protein E2C01_017713 [Portunus trituberculatus]|uniref:Uncharacterized protein n=1 Tax=Portunus trituberculatus TaxID=210409 RepID=A0A5B7DTM5_PORTR|nr:hypothetical protein [Portunus trituberculatus]
MSTAVACRGRKGVGSERSDGMSELFREIMRQSNPKLERSPSTLSSTSLRELRRRASVDSMAGEDTDSAQNLEYEVTLGIFVFKAKGCIGKEAGSEMSVQEREQRAEREGGREGGKREGSSPHSIDTGSRVMFLYTLAGAYITVTHCSAAHIHYSGQGWEAMKPWTVPLPNNTWPGVGVATKQRC